MLSFKLLAPWASVLVCLDGLLIIPCCRNWLGQISYFSRNPLESSPDAVVTVMMAMPLRLLAGTVAVI